MEARKSSLSVVLHMHLPQQRRPWQCRIAACHTAQHVKQGCAFYGSTSAIEGTVTCALQLLHKMYAQCPPQCTSPLPTAWHAACGHFVKRVQMQVLHAKSGSSCSKSIKAARHKGHTVMAAQEGRRPGPHMSPEHGAMTMHTVYGTPGPCKVPGCVHQTRGKLLQRASLQASHGCSDRGAQLCAQPPCRAAVGAVLQLFAGAQTAP